MPNLDPTYLRYIYDGLIKGSIHPENAAELPDRLIGLYEKAFEEHLPVLQRQQLLQRFALFALLKKEVSVVFVAEVLEESETDILDFINTYASWFNSPEPGKFQLYHERLKVYVLSKLSEKEIQELHEKLIARLELSIEKQKADEFERYGLEFLSEHLYLSSQQDIQYKRLHEFVNSEIIWQRQIEVSIGYGWSQKAIQYGIKEAARRELEINTLRSSVNSVKLWQQEQNSTVEILRLLSIGCYEIALKRAENWDLERQFKLYLLMLHELTIGESREAVFQKESCIAIMNKIAQTPEDLSVLDWTRFYPEYGVYQISTRLIELELDVQVIWNRGNYVFEKIENWDGIDVNLIYKLILRISDDFDRDLCLSKLAIECFRQNSKTKSNDIIDEIKRDKNKINSLLKISQLFAESGDFSMSKEYIVKCISIADNNSDEEYKSIAYIEIYKQIKQLELKIDFDVIKQKAYNHCAEILNPYFKSTSYIAIAMICIDVREKDEAEKAWIQAGIYIQQIEFEDKKDYALKELSELEVKLGKMDQAICTSLKIEDDWWRAEAIAEISKSFTKSGNLNEAKKNIYHLKQEFMRSSALQNIIIELVNNDKIVEGLKLIEEIRDNGFKDRTYVEIIKILSIKENITEPINLISKIDDTDYRAEAYKEIIEELYRKSNFNDFNKVSEKFIEVNSILIKKEEFFIDLLKHLHKNEMFSTWSKVMKEIKSDYNLSRAYSDRIKNLVNKGNLEEAIIQSEIIPYESTKVKSLIKIFEKAIQNKKNKFIKNLEKKIIQLLEEETDLRIRAIRIKELECILMLNNRKNKALMFHKFYIESISKISTKHFKVACLASVSSVLKQYDYIEESTKEMDKAIELANHSENDEYCFSEISENLIKQKQIELGIKIAKENLSIDKQHEIFFLAVELYSSQKKFDKAIELINSMELLSYVKKSLIICGKSISIDDLFQFKINEIDKKISSVIEGYILGNSYTFVTKNQKCLAFLLLGNDAKNIMEYLYHFAAQLIFIDKDFNSEFLSILSEVINTDEFIEISES